MTGPVYDPTKPNTASPSGWGAEIDAIRENGHVLMMMAAALGYEMPKWDTAATYGGTNGELTQIVMTFTTDTTIKMKWDFTYDAGTGKLDTTKWYYQPDSGTGYELLPGGTLTADWTSGKWDGVAST